MRVFRRGVFQKKIYRFFLPFAFLVVFFTAFFAFFLAAILFNITFTISCEIVIAKKLFLNICNNTTGLLLLQRYYNYRTLKKLIQYFFH